MPMGLKGRQDHFSSLRYRLVPWMSWEEWNFVHEALFSTSPESVSKALNRIIAWQSRGCLPVSVEITATIKDIHQRDPFFMDEVLEEHVLSEVVLRMAYSMAIVRLLNGVVDQLHKKRGQSINDSANSIGLPRLLVDIRHEASHNQLPTLPLLRLASKQALDWLKSHYWEPQKNVFPNIRPEIEFRLYMLALHIKRKQSMRAAASEAEIYSLKKQIKSNLRRLVQFCTAYPSEVVSVLLEVCLLKEGNLKDKFEAVVSNTLQEDIVVVNDLELSQLSREDWKSVVDAVCLKKPDVVPLLITTIVERIIAIEASEFEQGKLGSLKNLKLPSELETLVGIKHPHTRDLVFWVTQLLKDLEMFRKATGAGEYKSVEANTSFWQGPVQKTLLQELLLDCLQSLAYSSALSEPVLIIAKLLGNIPLMQKVEYLVKLRKIDQERNICAEDSLDQHSTLNSIGQGLIGNRTTGAANICNILLSEEDNTLLNFNKENSLRYDHDNRDFRKAIVCQSASLERAKQQLVSLKSMHTKRIDDAVSENGRLDEDLSTMEGHWIITKDWKPCAIGMLPSISTSHLGGVLPVLGRSQDKLGSGKVLVIDEEKQAYQGTECSFLTISHNARMDKNEAIILNQRSEQGSRPSKVARGDDKHVSEVREVISNNGAESYSALYEQKNVKKLRKAPQKECMNGSGFPRGSNLVESYPHATIQAQLLIDGVMKPCGSEELKAIQAAVHIFESFQQ